MRPLLPSNAITFGVISIPRSPTGMTHYSDWKFLFVRDLPEYRTAGPRKD